MQKKSQLLYLSLVFLLAECAHQSMQVDRRPSADSPVVQIPNGPGAPNRGGPNTGLPPGYVNPMYTEGLPPGVYPAGTHNGRATQISGPSNSFDPRNAKQTQIPEDLAGSLCPPFSQMIVSQPEEDQADFSFNEPLMPYGQQMDPRLMQNMPAYMQGNMPNAFARGPQFPNPRFPQQQQRPLPQNGRNPRLPGQGEITVADLIRAASTGSSITGDAARDDKILSDILGAGSSGTKRIALNAMTASGLSRPALESLGLVDPEEELKQIVKDEPKDKSDRKSKKDDDEEIGLFRRIKKRAAVDPSQPRRQNEPLFPEADFIAQARRGQQAQAPLKNPQFRTAALLAALAVASGKKEYPYCMYFIAKHVGESSATGPDSNAFKAYAEAVFKHVGSAQAADGNRRFDEKYAEIKTSFSDLKEQMKEFAELSKMSKETRDLKIKTLKDTIALTHESVKARLKPIRKDCAGLAAIDRLPKGEGFLDTVESALDTCKEYLESKIRNIETTIELKRNSKSKSARAEQLNLAAIAKLESDKSHLEDIIAGYLRGDAAPSGGRSNYEVIKSDAANIDSSFEQISAAKNGVGLPESQWKRYQEVRKDLANTGDAYVFWTLYKAGI